MDSFTAHDIKEQLRRIADALEFFVQRAEAQDAKTQEDEKCLMRLSNQHLSNLPSRP